jgi:hypothetical protein
MLRSAEPSHWTLSKVRGWRPTTSEAPFSVIRAFFRTRIAVFKQTHNQVFKRNPGDRMLVGPYPVEEEAAADWQFAMLSVAAYGRSNPDRQPSTMRSQIGAILQRFTGKEISGEPVPNVDAILEAAGWKRWSDFPDAKLEKHMARSHLRAEVWENLEQSAVVAAFGGTVFTSGKDWKANLRWFLPKHQDEYTEIVRQFGPDFVQAFANRVNNSASPYSKELSIYSTGHSLGGGLAQQFAYSMPLNPDVPRVKQVLAFDPSPVTGFYSVHKRLRNTNKRGLKIARIYERGEILAILRSFTSLIWRPTAKDAEIRGVRFSLFPSGGGISDHSMEKLAKAMQKAAGL